MQYDKPKDMTIVPSYAAVRPYKTFDEVCPSGQVENKAKDLGLDHFVTFTDTAASGVSGSVYAVNATPYRGIDAHLEFEKVHYANLSENRPEIRKK
jgi:hypothetical protein